MDSSKFTAFLFILILSLSTTPQTLACDFCPKNTPPAPKSPKSPESPKSPASPNPGTPFTLPPIITNPPVTIPTFPVPPIGNIPPYFKMPPVNLPPFVRKPPFKVPPFGLPPFVKNPHLTMPPISLPPFVKNPPLTMAPIGLPPLFGHGTRGTKAPPPPPAGSCHPPPSPTQSCPIDALKLGACASLLGNSANVADTAVECCPVLDGLAGVAAAACLCTAIKAKLLNVDWYLPVALKVVVACGSSVPAGYTCP